MARMHSRDKGKAGSKKPVNKSMPSWLKYGDKEVELLIAKLAKEDRTSSQIGMYLRDVYGIPDVRLIIDKKITKVLEEKGLASKLPEDLTNLIKRGIMLRKHLERNKQDMTAKRGLQLTESKIRRLVKYYKKSGKIEQKWNYNPANAKLYIGA